MIATLELTETACRTAVEQYLATVLGAAYHAGRGQLRNGAWVFTVTNQRAAMKHVPAVGAIAVDAVSDQVETVTADQIRNMREAGAVQAAQERRELGRDEKGYILRRHARIKANNWISDRVGLKVGAEGVYLYHWIRRFGVLRFAIIRLGHLLCLMSMHKRARLIH